MSQRTIRRAAERKAKKLEQKNLKAIAQAQTMDHNLRLPPPALPQLPINQTKTGGKTPEGKAISAQNSVRHGCCSNRVRLLNDEQMVDYLALERVWFDGYKVDPFDLNSAFEGELIRTCVNADWLARRAERAYADLEADLFNAKPKLIEWTDEEHKKLALANRYRIANRNSLIKARKALEDYRKARISEKAKDPKPTHNQKNPYERTWEEQLAEAREISIRLGHLNPDGTLTAKC